MDELKALLLTQSYIDGWKENNLEKIIGNLDIDIKIIESHGPTYIGTSTVKHWFNLWLKLNSKVIKWDISSFYFCEKNICAFCDWNFLCITSEQKYEFLGSSIIKFSDNKIKFIQEYRMTKSPYLWGQKVLNYD